MNVEQSQKITQRIKPKSNEKPPKPKTPKPKVPIKPIVKLGLAKRILTKVQSEPDTFEAFFVKGNKEVSLGKKTTQQGAELLLKGKLTSSLSASGLIKKGGTTLKSSELKSFGSEFRPSKQNEFKIVELKEKRLRKSSTGKEIQMFRGKRGGIF